jgi:hypothetical protein
MTKLAKLMSERDLTDRTLADMVGAPEVEIWRLRKGPHNRGQKMSAAWARRLALALEVDWSEMLDEEAKAEAASRDEPAKAAAPKKSARAETKGVAVYGREQEPLSRDDLRVVHGIVSACAFSCAPSVRISVEAFRDLIQRAIENAAYDHSDLASLADKIAWLLGPGRGDA